MRTIGLIGGMSWESTQPYYRLINQIVQRRLGGLHSARLLMHSVDFHDIEVLQRAGRWDDAGRLLAGIAKQLESSGAECIVLCTNTMHKIAPAIEAALSIPFLHICDAVGAAIQHAELRRIGLLGTRFTMEQTFYRERLEENFGLNILIPPPATRERIHRVIYDELCKGIFLPESRADFCGVIDGLVAEGAQGIILGCTEIGLLLDSVSSPTPLFDTTALHAACAVNWALQPQ